MRQPLVRILLGIEYLVAVQVLIAFWAHAGGQYHLDLMFWPWKFGLPLAAASIVVAITAALANGAKWRSARTLLLAVSLAALMLVAGIVTYYYHVNEPAQEDEGDQPAQITRTATTRGTISDPVPSARWLYNRTPSGIRAYSKPRR